MPGQVMNDITNLGGGLVVTGFLGRYGTFRRFSSLPGEAHRPKHKTQDVMDGKENQAGHP